MDALDLQFGRYVLDVAVKATALLAVTAVALLALRKASAATRHLVAVVGLAGALAIPGLAWFLPSWELPILPRAERALKADALFAGEDLATQKPLDPAFALRSRDDGDASVTATLARVRPGIIAVARKVVIGWVALTWAALAALVLARLAVGISRVRRAARRAVAPPREGWAIPYIRASRALRLRRFVHLGVSDEVEVAMTAGVRQPVVLVPGVARAWPEERRRLVLLHELAHVKRFDWLAQIVCEAALAVWWFHPLAWLAAARVRRDAELAADDLVLRSGERPSVYAGHLLEIVRSLRAARGTVGAMAMARASGFESRLRALLETRRRGPASALGRIAAAGLSGIALVLAAAHPTAARASEECPLQRAAMAEIMSEDGSAAMDARGAPAPFAVRAADILRDTGRALADATSVAALRKTGGVIADLGTMSFYRRGMSLHRAGRYQEAIEVFRKAIDHGDRPAAATYNIACGFARLGDRDAALQWLEKASVLGFDLPEYLTVDEDLSSLRSDPRFLDLVRRSSDESSQAQDKARRAVERFDSMSDDPPATAQPWYAVAKELYGVGEYDRAADAFRESARRAVRPGVSLYNAACALALGGETSAALHELERAVEAGFDEPKLLRTDSDLESIRTDRRFARIVEMEAALAFPNLHMSRFLGRLETDRWRAAAERFEGYARAHPDSGRAYFSAGLARLYSGDAAISADRFSRALSLGYRQPATFYNLACAEAQQGHVDRSFAWLAKAVDAGFDASAVLRSDDDLESLRADPRFTDLLRRADVLADSGAARSH
jgi:beta-lactamase regulating signal transducer with metallopeptidase domain